MQYRSFLLAGLAVAFAAPASAAVTPPPLPPGAAMVRLEAGMSEPERKRQIRAHHHKGHQKKDHTRDDSLESHGPVDTGAPVPGGNPRAGGPKARK
jgi:hypothetical protein